MKSCTQTGAMNGDEPGIQAQGARLASTQHPIVQSSPRGDRGRRRCPLQKHESHEEAGHRR